MRNKEHVKPIEEDRQSLDAPSSLSSRNARQAILWAVCIALMAVIAAVTGLNVAQPQLAVDLHATQASVLWMINTYAISLAGFLLPLGAVGDRWGRKRVLIIGLCVFAFATAASGLASSTTMMLAARFLSGIGAAMIMPVTLSVITAVFPPHERSKAVGIWTAVAGGGGIVGMFLSALLVDFLSWRWLFLLPFVLAFVALVTAVKSIPETRDSKEHSFDYVGALLSFVAIVSTSFGLHEAPAEGWINAVPLVALLAGVSASIAFFLWEFKHEAPLLPVRYLANRDLAAGMVSLLIWFGVQAGVFIVLYPYFQAVLGWSGLRSTAGLMPMAILMMAFSAGAPRLGANLGPKYTVAVGIAFGIIGLMLMATQVTAAGGYLSVLPGMVAMGIGMGLAMPPSTEAITTALPEGKQGVASAINDLARELGTSLRVALLGAFFAAGYTRSIQKFVVGADHAIADPAVRGIGTAFAAYTSSDVYGTVYEYAQASFVEAWRSSMWVGVALMACLLGFVLLRGPRRTQADTVQNDC